MIDRIEFLWPEIALFVTTCVVMVLGLSRRIESRRMTALVTGLGLIIAGVLAARTTPIPGPRSGQVLLPELIPYAKVLIASVGSLLLLLQAGTVDRAEEAAIAAGQRPYDPLRTNRAEYYAFFLFSLTGLMLCASADDLIWLFLALELTSLPTYIMVAMSTGRARSREAGVKYFFLGALGAAVFLYGFALIYGGTGSTNLNAIHAHLAAHGLNLTALAGFILAFLGLCFKIAAVPMHFYAADVYQGAAPQVSAFLAFVPKAAGFISILLLTATIGWSYAADAQGPLYTPITQSAYDALEGAVSMGLPEPIRVFLWVIAALTMTVGNVLAILQKSVKRILAYSSIAHSGYMLVAVLAGPNNGTFSQSGLAAVLFYLLVYGVGNLGAFAVLACLEGRPDADGEPAEIEDVDDIRGLWKTRPLLAWVMTLSCLGLMGLPPLLGFFGKLPLFTSGLAAGEIVLVVILGLNSAVAAYYYLRLIKASLIDPPSDADLPATPTPFATRTLAGVLSAAGVVVLAFVGGGLMDRSERAARYTSMMAVAPPPPPRKTPYVPGDDTPFPLPIPIGAR
ncbi:MAG: NADH-quinone oxidoreductase subunit N [Phycisphaerae bacterium]|nr:NADH-quinone oxidoreductase subunit N [Phycisphaerae bacterium]